MRRRFPVGRDGMRSRCSRASAGTTQSVCNRCGGISIILASFCCCSLSSTNSSHCIDAWGLASGCVIPPTTIMPFLNSLKPCSNTCHVVAAAAAVRPILTNIEINVRCARRCHLVRGLPFNVRHPFFSFLGSLIRQSSFTFSLFTNTSSWSVDFSRSMS